MTRRKPSPARPSRTSRKTRRPRTVRRPTAGARARILDAAIAEFAARGFEAASTNTIAREAKVAKGLVFHHFGSKEDMYLAIVEHLTERITEEVFAIDPMPSDLFERLHAFAIQKLRIFQRDPAAFQLLMTSTDAPASLREHLEKRRVSARCVTWPRFLEGLDTSRLRPGITLEDAIATLTILGIGIERTYLPQLARMPDRGQAALEAMTAEVWTHFERMRDGLYA
ncbi:MAG: TetR/AcrR family transcriptional regulator [Kofleriaceae bacterium]|nr:TetR/AcrR family transcriptional regulator [Kofleriaceae bacterium]